MNNPKKEIQRLDARKGNGGPTSTCHGGGGSLN